ncbi:MAG: molybdate ABC transporter substrate-binding protein [Solirubrobacterales bacterium]|nr:molybdate ABC transporter substrate-binding protein [Solirubrobacterales bacterium]
MPECRPGQPQRARWCRAPVVFALAVAGLVGATAIGCGGDGGPELTVLAASSLQAPLTAYGQSMPGLEVRESFGGSDLLAAQIRQGAGADVYAAAETALPNRLFREGLVRRPRAFASNRLAIAVPAGSTIGGLSDLARPGGSVLLGDEGVPIGEYADWVLARLPSAEREAILANVGSREPEASSITAKLVQGAADAGIVYRTDVRTAGGSLEAVSIPGRLQPAIAYAAAVVKGAARPALARRYVDGLIGGEGAVQLRRAGFLPPDR